MIQDGIVLGIIAVLAVLVLLKMRKDRKSGKTHCGGGCSGCALKNTCHEIKERKESYGK